MSDRATLSAFGEAGRLQIGVGIVDIATREIFMPEARGTHRVTPKAMTVLCLLAETPGRVVTRAELLEQAWPDTLPTDDVLTQAITQLRKAFSAGSVGAAEGRRYIETIAKTGYRLTVPVQALMESAEDVAAEMPASDASEEERVNALAVSPSAAASGRAIDARAAPPAGTRRRGRFLLAATVVLLAAVVVLGILVVNMHVPPDTFSGSGPSKPYRLITNSDGFELSPTLSPDAAMVAYSVASVGLEAGGEHDGSPIMLQTTTSAAPRRLTSPGINARDDLPTWSPDGREIAFARWEADGTCRIMLVPVLGTSVEREIARCDGSELLSFEWTPGGDALVFGSMTGDPAGAGIRLLDPVSGHWQSLVYDQNPGNVDFRPRYSPDGKWIVFVRNPQLGDLWRIPAQGGRAEQLTRVGAEIRGWSWLDSGDRLVFGMRVGSQSRLFTYDLVSQSVRDVGLDDAQAPTVSRRGGMMAFVHRNPGFGLYRIQADSSKSPERMFASSGRDGQPTVAPDGRQIVFTSDRAGRFELWWATLGRPESLRPIEGLRPDTRQAPVWSEDSTRVLVSAFSDDGGAAILEVEPGTGQVGALPVPVAHPLQALYTADPSRMLVLEEAEGTTRLTLYDRARAPWRALASIRGVSNARFDAARDKVLFTRLDSDGLWESDVGLTAGLQRLVAAVPSRWHYRNWALVEGGVSYLHATAACRSHLSFLDFSTEENTPIRCLDAAARNGGNGFSADPIARTVFVTLAPDDGSDIGFMPVPKAEGAPQSLIAKWLNGIRKNDS